jgi:hypothetical protein
LGAPCASAKAGEKTKKTVAQAGFQAAKRKSLFIEVSILSGQNIPTSSDSGKGQATNDADGSRAAEDADDTDDPGPQMTQMTQTS